MLVATDYGRALCQARGRRQRALDLLSLAPGLYATQAPRRLMYVDVPALLATMPSPRSRGRLVGRYAVDCLREMGVSWPIVIRYGGVGWRQ